MGLKRFQDCNWLVKLWRYRFYVAIPFKWLWYTYVKDFYVTNDETLMDETVNKRELWGILIGTAQFKMCWYHTWEEVKGRFKFNKDNDYDYVDDVDDVDDSEYWKHTDREQSEGDTLRDK